MGALTSMNIFLRQEIDRMQRVITIVRTTLIDLKLAIDGTIIMSENLKDALDNIFDARVPGLWKKVSEMINSYTITFIIIIIVTATAIIIIIIIIIITTTTIAIVITIIRC
jgi:hypothetical protein